MGGDSAGVGGYDLHIRADEKVFTNGDFIMGFTSSFRMGQLLRYKFKPPYHMPGIPIDEYMVTTFVDEVRKCLKEGGFARSDNGEESGGKFLVGYRGELFYIDSDYQVGRLADGFAAAGCGDQIAHGALYATNGKPPEERINTALEAAERFSAGVRGPFVIKSL
jgi:hypothetical protein